MRIKIIGDNNCARATRHLLRMAGFAVTEYLPVEAVINAPHSGYAITIDLAPAPRTCHSTHGQPAVHGEALPVSPFTAGGASSLPSGGESGTKFGSGDELAEVDGLAELDELAVEPSDSAANEEFKNVESGACAAGDGDGGSGEAGAVEIESGQAETYPTHIDFAHIHFDSVDSALEAAVLRHVTRLTANPVSVDRPGGVVHSERELRIVLPHTDDPKANEATAVAVEFGVLRGLLDLTASNPEAVLFRDRVEAPASAPADGGTDASLGNEDAENAAESDSTPAGTSGLTKRKWWLFGVALLVGLGFLSSSMTVSSAAPIAKRTPFAGAAKIAPALEPAFAAALEPEAQGQFFTGPAIDPCKLQTKSYASINQTANTQIVSGTSSKKTFYICSVHVVVASATNVALVEGTGSVCATGTSGVNGFGGATAATGWNFAANGGIAFGNGDSSLGAEVSSADNLCVFNSGSGQVSGGISYVVQ